MSEPVMEAAEQAHRELVAAATAADDAYWRYQRTILVIGSIPGTPERDREEAEKLRLREELAVADAEVGAARRRWLAPQVEADARATA